MWHSQGQSCKIRQSSAQEGNSVQTGHTHGRAEDNQVASLMMRRSETKRTRSQNQDFEDDDSEAEEDQLVCNMTGERWEDLPFPVIIDSGACGSVMSTD